MAPSQLSVTHQFMICDELGQPVEAIQAVNQQAAIEAFCENVLEWKWFEAELWSCREITK